MAGGGGGGGVGGGVGGGIPPIGIEKKQSSPVHAVYLKTLLCLWLTEESFWRLWCSATPHFSRQTALRHSSGPAKLPISVKGCLRTIIVRERHITHNLVTLKFLFIAAFLIFFPQFEHAVPIRPAICQFIKS